MFAATTPATVGFTPILLLPLFKGKQLATSTPVMTTSLPASGFLIGYDRLYRPFGSVLSYRQVIWLADAGQPVSLLLGRSLPITHLSQVHPMLFNTYKYRTVRTYNPTNTHRHSISMLLYCCTWEFEHPTSADYEWVVFTRLWVVVAALHYS